MYDIRNQANLHGFGSLPKDNDGTACTINECINHIITTLESHEHLSNQAIIHNS